MPGKSSEPARNRPTATSSAAIRAAVARGPIRPASRAIRRAGNRASSGARNVERAESPTRSGGGRRRRARCGNVRAYWIGRRMSGVPSWALSEPSTNTTAEWTTLCGWMTTSIASYVDIVQPVCLDDLQALVGEGRRIDRDLGPHPPRRVAERLLGGDAPPGRPGRRGTVRPTPSGASRAIGAGRLAGQALPDRRVLRVDRPEPGQRAREGIARIDRRPFRGRGARASGMTRWPPATSVSLLAVATTLPAASAARTGRRLTTPPSRRRRGRRRRAWPAARARRVRRSRAVPAGRSSDAGGGFVGDAHDGRAHEGDLLGQHVDGSSGRQRDHLERLRMTGQHLDRLAADRPGTAEERDPDRPLGRPATPGRAAPRPGAAASGRSRRHTGSRSGRRTGTN